MADCGSFALAAVSARDSGTPAPRSAIARIFSNVFMVSFENGGVGFGRASLPGDVGLEVWRWPALDRQHRVMTASRYSLGTTSVFDPPTLRDSSSFTRSPWSRACPSLSRAAKALWVGP